MTTCFAFNIISHSCFHQFDNHFTALSWIINNDQQWIAINVYNPMNYNSLIFLYIYYAVHIYIYKYTCIHTHDE